MSDAPPGGSVRVAGIDMGSNSTRLHVADVSSNGTGELSLQTIEKQTTVTRLGEQVDTRGILLPQAIARTRNALSDFRRAARDQGAVFVLATATSAVRDADNGEAFLGEVEFGYGFRTLLLDGSEEARFSWRGVTCDEELSRRAQHGTGWLIDIGGGSTEVVLTRSGDVDDHHSFQLGCVRLTERFLSRSDPPSADDLVQAYRHVGSLLADRFPNPASADTPIAVAGTVTTLATLVQSLPAWDPERTHRFELGFEDVALWAKLLAEMTSEERAHVRGMEPRRAGVILAGVVILESAMRHFGLDHVIVSERDILDAIALEAGRIALAERIDELPEPHGRTPC